MFFDIDAFAHGPIESKLWLCHTIKQLKLPAVDNLVVLGAWSGTMPLLVYATSAISFQKALLVDTNEEYQEQSRKICNTLDCQGKLLVLNTDANKFAYVNDASYFVINTSTDNIVGNNWFKNIPAGTWVALQGRTGGHRDCVLSFTNTEEFNQAYPLTHTSFIGQKRFSYPSHGYARFMKIGIK